MDRLTTAQRSSLMSKVRCGDTKPERTVRRLLHALGLRFRLHRKDLPGRPDIVLARWRTVILVHGCFWHRHRGCIRTTTPAANFEFWRNKFEANVRRDRRLAGQLRRLGWRVVVIWECETLRPLVLEKRLRRLRAAHEVSGREW